MFYISRPYGTFAKQGLLFSTNIQSRWDKILVAGEVEIFGSPVRDDIIFTW